MSADLADRRYLAAVRFVDRATGTTIDAPLQLDAEGCRWFQNRGGLWVARAAPGLAEHTRSFEGPPSSPTPGAVQVAVDVVDPSGMWLPRRFQLGLPRDPDEAGLTPPVDVSLPPSPAAPTRRNWGQVWAAVRLISSANPEGVAVEGALLRVTGGGREAFGLTDTRGEGLVRLPGIPLFSSSDGGNAVIERRTTHRLWVVVDQTGTDPRTGRRHSPPDLDELWARRATASCVQHSRSFSLAAGESRSFSINFTVP